MKNKEKNFRNFPVYLYYLFSLENIFLKNTIGKIKFL